MGNDEGSKQKNISDTIAHDGDVLPPSMVFYMVQSVVSSYLTTTLFFYLLSAAFFGLYFFLSDTNLKGFIIIALPTKKKAKTFKSKITKLFI
jgi:hypothetical protein